MLPNYVKSLYTSFPSDSIIAVDKNILSAMPDLTPEQYKQDYFAYSNNNKTTVSAVTIVPQTIQTEQVKDNVLQVSDPFCGYYAQRAFRKTAGKL